ncbi:hypothetical protein [Pseudomonas cerasi]
MFLFFRFCKTYGEADSGSSIHSGSRGNVKDVIVLSGDDKIIEYAREGKMTEIYAKIDPDLQEIALSG